MTDYIDSSTEFLTDKSFSDAAVFAPLTPEHDVQYSDEFVRVISGQQDGQG